MKKRYTLLFSGIICLLLAGTLFAATDKSDKFKLKADARGKVCLGCHATFVDKLKSPFVHTPVKAGACTGCHNPHASSNGKLLAADPSKICARCHSVIPAKAASVHSAIGNGKCTVCHDPHASNNKFALRQPGNALCFGCHNKMEESVSKAKFAHAPVKKDCLGCHNPHASEKNKSLLKDVAPALCVKCHKTDTPLFSKQHMNYPVAASRCTTCHNVHGSDKGGMLFNNVHKPVAAKMCNQCHEDAASATPFKTKKAGNDLCRGCHSNMMNEMFLKSRIHWPVLSKKGCLTCHNPHASSETGLRKEPLISLCGSCHDDTIDRQNRSVTKHAPVADGYCTACHQPHAADSTFLLGQGLIDLCGTCHDWQKHQSHPMGEKVRDKRNKNLSVVCLSCHSAHGTDFKNMLLAPTVSEMCTQCHVEYRR